MQVDISKIAFSSKGKEIFPLDGVVQHYDWGGYDYLPALLGKDNTDQVPYAELWFGAHPKSPSTVTQRNLTLDRLIADDPSYILGVRVSDLFEKKLPYLLKVLDVRKMLSIQVHPSKESAKLGFERENAAGISLDAPNRNYKDSNHKPEVMVALSDFWLLHGFQPVEQLIQTLKATPELVFLIDELHQKGLPELYAWIMRMEAQAVDAILRPLVERLLPEYKAGRLAKNDPGFWAARAAEQYVKPGGPIDRGIFSIYLFNLVFVPKGKGTYQAAGVPHAYLEGVNVELMANSDNVLRGGLTPKYIDVDELLKHTRCEPSAPSFVEQYRQGSGEVTYLTPAIDFELSEIRLLADDSYHCKPQHGPDILLSIAGSASIQTPNDRFTLHKGAACLIPANIPYAMEIYGSDDEHTQIFKAGTPVIGNENLE